MFNIETQCEGWFSLSAFKVDESGEEIPGSRRSPVPPFKNLITDSGLDRMGDNSDYLSFCQVGAGSTAPAVGDTALASRVAGTFTIQSTALTVQSSAPYYVARTNTYRFAAGVAAGNLAEVGVGWGLVGSLYSRALILDAMGTPTTITVLADELLDVTYQIRQYMPTVDWSGSITLRGVVHSVTGRACSVTSSNAGGWAITQYGTAANFLLPQPSAYTGAIGAVTATSPGGSLIGSPQTTTGNGYSSGSLQRDIVIFYDNTRGNNASGIGSIKITMGIGSYQFGFTPSIMKTSDDTLSLTFRHSWARKVI